MSMYDPSIYSDQTGAFLTTTAEAAALPEPVSPVATSSVSIISDEDSQVWTNLTLIGKDKNTILDYTFYVGPESIQMSIPSRVAVYQSIGGNTYIDHLGEGVKSISIQGNTAYKGKPSIGFGYAQYQILRQIINRYNDECRLGHARSVQLILSLRFPDSPDYGVWPVTVREFTLSRNASQPLLFRYQLSLYCLAENSQEIGVNIKERQLQELPTVPREILEAAKVAADPAAAADGPSGPGGGPSGPGGGPSGPGGGPRPGGLGGIGGIGADDQKPPALTPDGYEWFNVPDWGGAAYSASIGDSVAMGEIKKLSTFSNGINGTCFFDIPDGEQRIVVIFVGPTNLSTNSISVKLNNEACTLLSIGTISGKWKYSSFDLGYTGYDTANIYTYYKLFDKQTARFNGTLTVTGSGSPISCPVAGGVYSGVDPVNPFIKCNVMNPTTRTSSPRLELLFHTDYSVTTREALISYAAINVDDTATFSGTITRYAYAQGSTSSDKIYRSLQISDANKIGTIYEGMTVWASGYEAYNANVVKYRVGAGYSAISGVFEWFKRFFTTPKQSDKFIFPSLNYSTYSSTFDATYVAVESPITVNGAVTQTSNSQQYKAKTIITPGENLTWWIPSVAQGNASAASLPYTFKTFDIMSADIHSEFDRSYIFSVMDQVQEFDQYGVDGACYSKCFLMSNFGALGTSGTLEPLFNDPKTRDMNKSGSISIRGNRGFHALFNVALLKAYVHTTNSTVKSPDLGDVPKNIHSLVRKYTNLTTSGSSWPDAINLIRNDNRDVLSNLGEFDSLPSKTALRINKRELENLVKNNRISESEPTANY